MPKIDSDDVAVRRMLGQRIKQAREKNTELSASNLSRRMSISRSSVAQWEAGQTKPAPARLRRLAQIIGVTVDWLTHGTGVLPTGGGRFMQGPEGELIDIKTLDDSVLVATLKAAMIGRPHAQVWQINTDLMMGAHYSPGDYLIVDPDEKLKMAGQTVLAEHNGIPIFRLYSMPLLFAMPSLGRVHPNLMVDSFQVIIKGVVITKHG